MFHRITQATPLPDLRLLVTFSSGAVKQYDVRPLLDRWPMFTPLADVPGLFACVQVDPGGYGISWNDDIDISADELWHNGTEPAA